MVTGGVFGAGLNLSSEYWPDGADVFMRVDIGGRKALFRYFDNNGERAAGGAINDETVSELNACIDHFAIN